jgi:hypothetical protein
MSDGDISEGAWATWMHPRDALVLLSREFTMSDAAASILRRLKGGRIQAAAESSEWEGYRPQDPSNMIPVEYWKRVNVLPVAVSFWSSSDIEISVGPYNRKVIVQYFGVRFRPDQVQALLAGAPKAAPTQHPSGSNLLPVIGPVAAKAAGSLPKGPPVPLAALNAWAEAYRLTYGGTPLDKLDTAYKSAAGAFPGRTFSRDQIRSLVGGARKRGPKGPRQG